MAELTPDKPSSDYEAMAGYWVMVAAILDGTDAMRAAGETYLPKFPMEDQADYDFRLRTAKFTNVFRDIVESLAAKPFGEEVGLKDDGVPDRITTLVEDIDGKGNHLHVFAQNTFFWAISNGLDWILVDYTKGVPANATVAQEKALGARPYWLRVAAADLLAVYTAMVGGKETIVHARIRENAVKRNGYGETTVKRVRVLNREPILDEAGGVTGYAPATWHLFEEQDAGDGQSGKKWIEIDSGPITIGVIPLVPVLIGRRKGSSWRIVPPLRDAADLQIELYQQESGLKNIKESAAFPMLAGNGVSPPTGPDGKPMPISVGPKTVLYAPPASDGRPGSWQFIEPTANSLKFLADDVKETIQQLRELGRQPLTAQTGNLTVVTTAFAAAKANSAIQAWAINLKDALEQALVLTAMWLKEAYEPEIVINTDFALDLDDDKGVDALIGMRKSGDLSQRTLWHEMRRRSVLSPDFDAGEEEQAILDELPGDSEEDDAAALPPGPGNGPGETAPPADA